MCGRCKPQSTREVPANRLGVALENGGALKPVGWANHGAPVFWSDLQGGKPGAQIWRSAEADPRIDSWPQAAFLAFGGAAFAAGFGASLAFSFAANSCLTLRLMASTSTLYAVAASRSTWAAVCRVAACRMVISTSKPLNAPSSARRK